MATKKKTAAPELEIVVCLKPVPDPRRWDKLKLEPETMRLNRSQVPAVINALDLNAIEQALALREVAGGRLTIVSMAPPEAEEQLREALAMGGDRACLLTDRAFGGADTLATARVLAAAIRKLGRFDLVLCGAYSMDGSTSQVGPQLAEFLEIPDFAHVTRLDLQGRTLRAECRGDAADLVYEGEIPALLTLEREANRPRLPSMTGIRRAQALELVCWNAADLGLAPEKIGLPGSPTQMLNVFTPAVGRKGEILQGTAAEMGAALLARLRAAKQLN
jgi:electron transfer flavoprotein alpha/beta subunit